MRLSDAEVSAELAKLDSWERVGDTIERTIRFPEFMDGIRFIGRVAEAAERADHHPDIDIRYRNVRLVLSTHSEGGLTEKDFAAAREIDSLVG